MPSLTLPWHSFVLFPHILSSVTRSRDQHLPVHSPPQGAAGSREVASWLLFSRLGNPSVISLSSQNKPASPLTSFVALVWMLSRALMSFSYCGAQTARNIKDKAAPTLI